MNKFYPVLIPAMIILASCSPKKNKQNLDDIILLNESQVTNFVNILPVIFKFSDKYYSGLSQEERDSTNYNLKFFEALEKDNSINKLLPEYNFSNSIELIKVYNNVVMEYTTITRDFGNYKKDLDNLRQTIDSEKTNYSIGLKDKSLSEDDRKVILSRLKDLADDEKRVSNIIIVRKYEKRIDDAYFNYYGKKK